MDHAFEEQNGEQRPDGIENAARQEPDHPERKGCGGGAGKRGDPWLSARKSHQRGEAPGGQRRVFEIGPFRVAGP